MSAADDNVEEKLHWHWRNTMRPVRFFNLDARAAVPFCALLLYARPITLFVAIASTLVFRYLESKGMTFPAAMRTLRGKITGLDRPAWITLRHRTMKDFG